MEEELGKMSEFLMSHQMAKRRKPGTLLSNFDLLSELESGNLPLAVDWSQGNPLSYKLYVILG
jgi:hypothetical protein